MSANVVQVIGPVVDVEFQEHHLPEIYNAVRITSEGFDVPEPIDVVAEVQQHLGEGRVRTVAMKPTEGMVRGMKAIDTDGPITVPVGRATLGRVLNVLGEPVDNLGEVHSQDALSHSPRGAFARRSVHAAGNVRDRHQGRGPDGAVPEGRKDRPLRRRRRGQDGADSGTDSQRGHEARRRLGVRRRGRAHARRQRPVAGNAGIRRGGRGQFGEIARGADLRPDDRAARSAPARGADGPDRGRIFPRRRRPGRAALHRQYFPLRAGGLGSFGAAGPHAFRRRLPAEPEHRNRRIAGAHHFHQERLDHLGAGHLRAGRRLHRSRAGGDLHAPGRHHEPQPADRGARHLSGGRSAGQLLAHSRSAHRRDRNTTTWRAR